MASLPSRKVVLSIGDGATPTENFTAIGSVTSHRVRLSSAVQESTNISSEGWREFQSSAGLKDVALTVQGVATQGAEEEALEQAAFSAEAKNFRLTFGTQSQLQGVFVVKEYHRNAAAKSRATYALQLQSSGAVERSVL